jgi:hypothetical protein
MGFKEIAWEDWNGFIWLSIGTGRELFLKQ